MKSENWKLKITQPGFTLIELLVAIVIIGLMMTVLVPNIDRSLGKNRLANDVELLRAKIQEARLLAGSTQQSDEPGGTSDPVDETGYYAVFLPGSSHGTTYFALIRLSNPFDLTGSQGANYCSADIAVNHADPQSAVPSGERHCLLERNKLSRSVNIFANQADRIVAFDVPSQQVVELVRNNNRWALAEPKFNWSIQLTFSSKTATVRLEPYTGKLTVVYGN